jgi:hypothetical protein
VAAEAITARSSSTRFFDFFPQARTSTSQRVRALFFFSAAKRTNQSRRISSDQRIGGNVLSYNRTRRDHRILTYWKLRNGVGKSSLDPPPKPPGYRKFEKLLKQVVKAPLMPKRNLREPTRSPKRAFISFSGSAGNKMLDPTGKTVVAVQFLTGWQNGGNTPTRIAFTHISWEPWSPDLPDNFTFPDKGDAETRPFVVGPKSISSIPMLIPIGAFDDAKNGRKRLFIWGWITYRDAFKGTPVRVSEFCGEVVNVSHLPPDW